MFWTRQLERIPAESSSPEVDAVCAILCCSHWIVGGGECSSAEEPAGEGGFTVVH